VLTTLADKGKRMCTIPRFRVHACKLQAQSMHTGVHACNRLHAQEDPAARGDPNRLGRVRAIHTRRHQAAAATGDRPRPLPVRGHTPLPRRQRPHRTSAHHPDYGELGLKDDESPKITRSNIVCAEPMPGEHEMLEEFARSLEPTVLGQLVENVFAKMNLASGAGSLLKIEQEIESTIAQARAQWQREFEQATDRSGNELLLTRSEMEELSDRTNVQMDLFDVSQVTDEDFWQRAEEQVIEALRSYSDKAANGKSYQRRLFADDAAQGFAFVDICRKRFDVVLMNPPFGDASKPSKAYIEKNYPRTKNDVYAAFVERGLDWLHPGGLLGAITSRTGFFLSSFRKWREEIVLGEARPTVVADLGQGVLDTAMVETAAYALEKSR
jgi:hypothetical protein